MSNSSTEGIGTLLGCGFVLVVIAVLTYGLWYAPNHRVDDPAEVVAPGPRGSDGKPTSRPALPEAEIAVRAELATVLPDSFPRLEFMKGNNLDIYLTRSEFETIPFPDREDVVKRVGKAWCAKVQQFLVPSVRIRDMRSGEDLASYRCVMDSVKVEQHR